MERRLSKQACEKWTLTIQPSDSLRVPCTELKNSLRSNIGNLRVSFGTIGEKKAPAVPTRQFRQNSLQNSLKQGICALRLVRARLSPPPYPSEKTIQLNGLAFALRAFPYSYPYSGLPTAIPGPSFALGRIPAWGLITPRMAAFQRCRKALLDPMVGEACMNVQGRKA